jgi:signal transduction histidine kinase
MIRSLHGKLSLVLMVLLLVAGALLVPLTLFTTRSYNEEVNQHLNRALASALARELGEKGLLRRDLPRNPPLRARTKAEISRLMVLNPSIEIYLLDENGVILDYSSAPGAVRLSRVNLNPVRRFLAGAGALPIHGTDPRQPSRGAVFSATRLPASRANALRGYVYIVLAGEDYQSVAQTIGKSYILRLGTWGIAGVLALTLGAAMILFPLLTRPLRRLATDLEAFRHLERSSLGTPSTRRDEIGQLQEAFARLSNRVGGQVQTLQQADIHRREAVSNVSHDLRTPLAALQGYLETLLMKEGQLSPEQQHQYLQTAMQHAQRLDKLITALFELAKLDSPEMRPNWEDFSLAELAQDVVQQFALAAEKKEVQMHLDFAEDLPFVRADIGLVERALENLLENALRHTPHGW